MKIQILAVPFIVSLLFASQQANAYFSQEDTLVKTVIAESAEQVSPLLNGQMVPKVPAVTMDGTTERLDRLIAGQKTILFFYRGGWCPFCNAQMGQLQKIQPQLKALGFKLIGISTDAPADLQRSAEKRELSYELLSDFDSKISSAFGLSFFTSAKTTKRYLAAMDLKNPLRKNKAGEERLVLPAPAIYIFDSNGLVQFNYVNPNFKVRLHSDLLLKAAELVK